MPGMSIHVVDVSRGVVATGMRVEVFALEDRSLIARGVVSAKGTLDNRTLDAPLAIGPYEAVFWSPTITVTRRSRCRPFRSSTSSHIASASPTRNSITTCRSNARPGAFPASEEGLRERVIRGRVITIASPGANSGTTADQRCPLNRHYREYRTFRD